jgi:hypothetical protein
MNGTQAGNAGARANLGVSFVYKASAKHKGSVIGQNHPPGTSLPIPNSVQLTVSTGWVRVPLLGIGGLSIATAQARLRHAGFRLGGLIWRQHGLFSLYSPGRVFGFRPNKAAPPWTRVKLLVATRDACTPGYSPCLRPHPTGGGIPFLQDYDCAGGSGDGPYYVHGTVRVTGNDVYYGLDTNHNGYGCE